MERESAVRTFADDCPIVSTSSLGEALSTSLSYRLEPERRKVSDIKFQEDFSILNGDVRRITDWGFYDFLKLLGIPSRLAKKLPNELLLTNINELLAQRDANGEMIFLRRENGDIATIIKPPFWGIQSNEVLTLFQDCPMFDVHVGEDFVQFAVEFGDPPIEPLPGDITKVGLKITCRVWHHTPLEGALFLYRLICSNGAVVKRAMGHRIIDFKLPDDLRLPKFRDDVHTLLVEHAVDFFGSRLSRMSTMHYSNELVAKIWMKIAMISGTELADTVFGLDRDARIQLRNNVTVAKSINKDRQAHGLEELPPELFQRLTQWEVFNIVTSFANKRFGREHYQFQSLGGSLIMQSMN